MPKLTGAEIRSQVITARARESEARLRGLRALGVRYDSAANGFVLTLSNGYLLGVPLTALPALAAATPDQLTRVAVSSEGGAVRVPDVDADYSVPALVRRFAETALGAPKE